MSSKPIPLSPMRRALTLTIAWTFAFIGLSLIQSVFRYNAPFTNEHIPGIITSYGASAVLVYGIPASPLAQPRALIGGYFLSALTGISISKLFQLMPATQFADVNWLGGALSTALALVIMDLTGTTHPPAGATAILPVVQANIQDLGWDFLWVVLISSLLLMGVGLVGNNILGRWPVFWIQGERLNWIGDGAMDQGEVGKASGTLINARLERMGSVDGGRSDTDVEGR